MSARGEQLHAEAERQITLLLERLGSLPDPERLRDSCAGREKLGDGTVAAVCAHVASVFERIAEFVESGRSDDAGPHHGVTAPAIEPLRAQLRAAAESLYVLRRLDDAALDVAPPKGAFRFADGERSLEQVLVGLLRHQSHHIDAVLRAISDEP